jgi:hypothetical protein
MAEKVTPEQIQYDADLAQLNGTPESSIGSAAWNQLKKAFDLKYPNGRPTSTPTNDIGANTVAAQAFGITKALTDKYPELFPVWQLFLAGNITDAKLAYYNTSYYKDLSSTSKNRSALKATQRGVYDQQLESYRLMQRKRLIDKGINLDDTVFNSITEAAFDSGIDDNQLDLKAIGAFTGKLGGTPLGTVQNLKEYANAFGMSYQDKDFDSWSRNIFSGTTTVEDLQAKIRTDAASAFPTYADQINKGVSVDALASAYKSSMANILEVDPDSIGYNDPTLRRALQSVGPDGKPITKPLWQFEKELKMDPRWGQTKNARDTMDSLSLRVLRDWGMA